MKVKRQIEIIVETHETTIVRFSASETDIYCAVCRRVSPHLTIARAAALLSLSPDKLARLIGLDELHGPDAVSRPKLLCGNSPAIRRRVSV